MSSSTRPIADLDALTLLIGLEFGFHTRGDVAEWVDARVMETAPASDALLELAFLSKLHLDEISALLRTLIPPGTDERRMRIEYVATAYRAGRLTVESAVELLTASWPEEDAFDRRVEDAMSLRYQLEDVKLGVYGTLEDVRRELEAYLAGALDEV